MSEEKRFIKNKKVIALSISLVIAIVFAGILGISFISVNNNYNDLSGDYDGLYIDYLELSVDFNTLDDQYFILTGEHIELENDYNALVVDLADMTLERDNLVNALVDMTTERDGLLAQIDILNAEISVHLATISDLNIQISDLEAEITVLEAQGIVDSETIADLNAQIVVLNSEIAGHLAIISGLEADIITHLTTISGLESDLVIMTGLRDGLQTDLDILQLQYDTLFGDYQILFDANVALQNTYDALLTAYNYITDTIRQSILPVQYSIFAEAVRRYYIPIYFGEKTGQRLWEGYTKFCRDMILHDSMQYNAFSVVSNAFSDALVFGNDTMYLANYIMNSTFYPWLPNWIEKDLSGDELTDIDIIVDWCIDEIDYEYDSDITIGQEMFDWDYIKFPVETAFRTMGDCEDQTILTATYLESCGFEITIAISHDRYNPVYGEFYHASLMIHIEDTNTFINLYGFENLWRFTNDPYYPEYTWCWLDSTWDIPFGSTPPWLQSYLPYGFPLNSITLGICDINGIIIQA